MKKQLDFLVQYEDRISRLAKALKWKIYHLLFGFSAQASTLGVFKHASGLGSTNLQIFRFNFPTKRLWASLICSKTARYRLFLAVVRCCVTTTLAAETFSLLSVYLNYKFGLGLPSFHLFFSSFKIKLERKAQPPPRDPGIPQKVKHFIHSKQDNGTTTLLEAIRCCVIAMLAA